MPGNDTGYIYGPVYFILELHWQSFRQAYRALLPFYRPDQYRLLALCNSEQTFPESPVSSVFEHHFLRDCISLSRYPLGASTTFQSLHKQPQLLNPPNQQFRNRLTKHLWFSKHYYHKGNPVDFLSVSKSNSTENSSPQCSRTYQNLTDPSSGVRTYATKILS